MATEEGGDDSCDEFLHNFEVFKEIDPASPLVLVFGGSTFMGRALVEMLVSRGARVCLVNRGREYWGTRDPSGGRAARVVADRRDIAEFAKRVSAATRLAVGSGGRWDIIADFSAYNTRDMRAALDGLDDRFRIYVYISSDSIYEVSSLAANGWLPPPLGTPPLVEEDLGVRPEDKDARRRLRKADSYGDGKLEAEEALAQRLASAEGCRSVSLRLPDVIGPFDDTLRLWAYWHWLQAGAAGAPPPQVRQLQGSARGKRSRNEEDALPRDPPLSFVFSKDVARFIVDLLYSKDLPPGSKRIDAVNLGCEQQVPLPDFLSLLAKASGFDTITTFAEVERPKSFLPSVDRPWHYGLRRLTEVYGFRPTPLGEVLKACADWFLSSCQDFPREARRAACKLPRMSAEAAVKRARLEDAPRSSSSSSNSSSSS